MPEVMPVRTASVATVVGSGYRSTSALMMVASRMVEPARKWKSPPSAVATGTATATVIEVATAVAISASRSGSNCGEGGTTTARPTVTNQALRPLPRMN